MIFSIDALNQDNSLNMHCGSFQPLDPCVDLWAGAMCAHRGRHVSISLTCLQAGPSSAGAGPSTSNAGAVAASAAAASAAGIPIRKSEMAAMQRLIAQYDQAQADKLSEDPGTYGLGEEQIKALVGKVVRHMLFKNFEKPGECDEGCSYALLA